MHNNHGCYLKSITMCIKFIDAVLINNHIIIIEHQPIHSTELLKVICSTIGILMYDISFFKLLKSKNYWLSKLYVYRNW